MFVLTFALLAGCGSSGSTSAGGTVTTSERLTGHWEGPDLTLRLTEVDGLVTGLGTVRRDGRGVPVAVTGERLPTDEVRLVLLPLDPSQQTDSLPAHGQLAQGSLQLRLDQHRDVNLRPAGAKAPIAPTYEIDAPPYRIRLGPNDWTSVPALEGGGSGPLYQGVAPEGGVIYGLLDSDGPPVGYLQFPGSGGKLENPSFVINPDYNRVDLEGIATLVTPSSPETATPKPSPAAVVRLWEGPDFKLEVTQAGSILGATGTFRGAPVRGTGRVREDGSAGLLLNGVSILRRADGQFTVHDAR